MSMKKFLAISLLLLSSLGILGCGAADNTGEKIDPVPVRDASALVNKHFIDPTADWHKYDELIAQIKQERDFSKRVQLMHQAEDFLMGTYAAVPLYYGCTTYLQKDDVKNVYCTRLGTLFLMNISKWLVRFKHLGAFLAYVGQNSLIVLILHGAIMRIFCDIFGFTGAPAGTFGLVNLAVFAATLFTSVLFIYIKGLMNNWTQKKKQAIRP